MKQLVRAGVPMLFLAAALVVPLANPGCSSDDCKGGTARVRVTVAGGMPGAPLSVTVQIADQTQVIASAPLTIEAGKGSGTADIAFPGGYPRVDRPLVVQVFATRPSAGGGGEVVVATGLAEVRVPPGCFSVEINLQEPPDAGYTATGDAGVADGPVGMPADANPSKDAPDMPTDTAPATDLPVSPDAGDSGQPVGDAAGD